MAKFKEIEYTTPRGTTTIYSFDHGRCIVKTVTKHATQWRIDAKPASAATAKRLLNQLTKNS